MEHLKRLVYESIYKVHNTAGVFLSKVLKGVSWKSTNLLLTTETMEFKVWHDCHILKHQIWLGVTVSRVLLNSIKKFVTYSTTRTLFGKNQESAYCWLFLKVIYSDCRDVKAIL